MQIKEAPNDLQSMSQDGDAILKSLQNKSLPIIDLMVREALQNSLDASEENSDYTHVDISVLNFEAEKLSGHFETIDKEINKLYGNEQLAIAISDKNTVGLTGEYRSNNHEELMKSNYHKLIFGIGKNQEADGAGGSWGLGKTSYFRMGAGIVIYYTRIKSENSYGYEERLVASLIESPKSEARLLPHNLRGIAWWGSLDENDNQLYPITDSQKINEILSVFNIRSYMDNETGTTIIIPFLNKELLDTSDIEKISYDIEQAIQRWYFPRLNNHKYKERYKSPMLLCSINKEVIKPENDIVPAFDLYQSLYTSALTGNKISDEIIREIYLPKLALEIPKFPIGRIAFKEFDLTELKMLAPENYDNPIKYFGIEDVDEQKKNKVFAYCRKPGMIVEYDLQNEWIPTSIKVEEGKYLFGIFVPISENKLISMLKEKGYENVESYLRATENADHAKWLDESGITIVSRLKKYVSKEFITVYEGATNNVETSATSSISRKFGKLLMPPTGYGKVGSKPIINKPNSEKNAVIKKPRIDIINSNLIDKKNIEVTVDISLIKHSKASIYLYIKAQDGNLDSEDWKKSFSEFQFPVQIVDYNTLDIIDSVIITSNLPNRISIQNNSDDVINMRIKIKIAFTSEIYLPQIAIKNEIGG